jgi:putative GTP pyrophosphokinase
MPDNLRARYEARQALLDDLRSRLQQETHDALDGVPHIDRISFRTKGTDSFVEKVHDRRVEPPYTDPLVEVEDQVAGRVIVFFLNDLEVVRDKLKGTFNTVERWHHRPPKDAEFGYESLHLICAIPPQCFPNGWEGRSDVPQTFELQLRTLFMHAYAEPNHDLGYKGAEELMPEQRRELAWVAASAWGADQALNRVQQQMKK